MPSKTLCLPMAMLIVLIATMSCGGKRVMVPPQIDLREYRTIALVRFDSNTEGNLDEFASQKFVEMMQSSQPGVRVLELGDSKEVLATVKRSELDHKAIRAIGEEYGVDAVVVGTLEVSDIKPSVDFTAMLMSGSVKADVEASLAVRLLDALSGATIWTNSGRAKERVAQIGISANGGATFGATNPEDAYGALVNGLIYTITDDFRVHYVRR